MTGSVKAPIRIVALTDSDSYVKWGAALLSRAPAHWDRSLFLLETPALPSDSQLSAALAGTETGVMAEVVGLEEFAARLSAMNPDIVLVSVRGKVVKVAIRTIVGATTRRPVIVTGLPGISVPATRLAVAHRAQADLFVVHSRREVREFSELAASMGVEQRFGLATLPFLTLGTRRRQAGRGDIVFATQAKVPAERTDRLALLGWLAETARRSPDRRVLIKVRAAIGEQQTHAETHEFATLLLQLDPPAPANLVVASGPMSSHLADAAALVTVSSTAAIEAVALGVPVLAINDFGVSAEMINPVFEGSGLLGSSADLVRGDFRTPDPAWLGDNYFHGDGGDTWLDELDGLLRIREAGALTLKPQRQGLAGGMLRLAWDRKRILGHYDRSLAGRIAIVIGTPLSAAARMARRAKRLVTGTEPV
ncbi:MAG: hypothetical protein JWO10_144 [Microbacteriaceae bacterium]|nr:hypothetical protein [Microbacteriaceae bacterium]